MTVTQSQKRTYSLEIIPTQEIGGVQLIHSNRKNWDNTIVKDTIGNCLGIGGQKQF